MAHTPGPWRCEESTPGDGHHFIRAADGQFVVFPDDGWNENYRNYEERLDNARLIAAAPDLLKRAEVAEGRLAAQTTRIESALMDAQDLLSREPFGCCCRYCQKLNVVISTLTPILQPKADEETRSPHLRRPTPRSERRPGDLPRQNRSG